jgi:YVTN family beta-propeller protein
VTSTIRVGAAVALLLLAAACTGGAHDRTASGAVGTQAGAPVGAPAAGAATTSLLEGGPYAFVSNEVDNSISVINVRTDSVVATLDPGQRPRGIRLLPNDKALVVAVSGSPRGGPGVDESKLPPADRSKDGLALVDLATRQVRRLPGGIDPENFDISPDGSTIFVANEDASAASVVDVASGAVKATINVGGEPEGVTVRPGGAEAWVTSEAAGKLYVIDTKTTAVTHVITVGTRPRSVVFTHDGKHAYAPAEVGGNVTAIDATTYRPIATVSVPGKGAKPMGSVMAPDDSKVYVSTGRGGTIAILDTKTGKFIGVVDVGSRPWGMALSDDGKELWVAGGPPGNDVSVIDLGTDRVVKKIPVGKAPWGVATPKY